MKLQDKLCDALTLVGLLAVIAAGAVSLLPEQDASRQESDVPPAEVAPATSLSETMEEVSMVKDSPQPEAEVMSDSLILDESDSVAVAQEAAADTAYVPRHAERAVSSDAEAVCAPREDGGTDLPHAKTHEAGSTGGEAAEQ